MNKADEQRRSFGALLWSPGALTWQTWTQAGLERQTSIDAPAAIGAHRYDAAVFPGSGLTIRLPGGSRAPFMQSTDGGATFVPVPAIPGEGPIEPHGCRAHADGTLTVLDGADLWLRPAGSSTWLHHRWPAELQVLDVSLDPEGRIHAAGAVPARGGTEAAREAAYAVAHGGTTDLLRLNLDERDAAMLERHGGAEAFRRIDATSGMPMLSSDCAWLHEDPSSFVLLASPTRWTVRHLKRQSLRTWKRDRTGAAWLVTCEGTLLRTEDHGVTWATRDLERAIERAWPLAGKARERLIMAADSDGHSHIIAVSLYDWDGNPKQPIIGSAILISHDDGRTWMRGAEVHGVEQELIGVSFL